MEILASYKDRFDFFAFGSRVHGTHKKYSDLDLAVIDKHNTGLTQLKNELSDSNLAITVDVADYNTLSKEFKELIDKEKIKISL